MNRNPLLLMIFCWGSAFIWGTLAGQLGLPLIPFIIGVGVIISTYFIIR